MYIDIFDEIFHVYKEKNKNIEIKETSVDYKNSMLNIKSNDNENKYKIEKSYLK